MNESPNGLKTLFFFMLVAQLLLYDATEYCVALGN